MRPFSLDHALRSTNVLFKTPEFLTYFLETKVPGVHFNVDDDERLPKSTISPYMLNAGRPRIVDGAREDHMIAVHLQNEEGWSSDNAAMKILEGEGSKGDPFPVSVEKKLTGDVVLDGNSHSQYLKFFSILCAFFWNGPNFLMKNPKDKETICSAVLTATDHMQVLPPANEPLPRDILNMTQWRASLWDLIQEMKTVEEIFPSLIGNYGAYVLTSSPYAAFLKALAAETANVRS